MPQYLYENKETGEVVEIFQSMKDTHEYHGEGGDEKGLWRRVYVNPNISSDTALDPFCKKSFVNSTINKNDTYGELFKRSEDASQMRAQKNGGVDPVKQKYYDDYKKNTNGQEHPHQAKEKFQKSLKKAESKGIKIDLN